MTYPQSSLEAVLDTHSRNQLARLARCDPSRIRRTDTSAAPWVLANDAWAVIGELIRFERLVAAARRGRAITLGAITLAADSFVAIFRDLTTYCIEIWDTRDYRRVCLVERKAIRLGGHMTRLFNRERKHRTPHRRRNENQRLIHVTDPAVRRLAIWLTLQVIACPAPPTRLSAMRLGRSPQLDFLGSWQHEGLAWLADRAQNWPADYRARCWPQFLPPSAINEGTVPSIKVRSATK